MSHSKNSEQSTVLGKVKSFAFGILPGASVAAMDFIAHVSSSGGGEQVVPHSLVSIAGLAGFIGVSEFLKSWHSKHINIRSSREYDQELREEANHDRLFNHHLAQAVGITIGDILEHLPENIVAQEETKKTLALMSVNAPITFREAINEGIAPQQLGENQLVELIQLAAKNESVPTGDVGLWKSLLKIIYDRTPDESKRELPEQVQNAIADELRKNFVTRFFNTIKSDLEHGGAAFASIHLRMMTELADLAKKTFAATEKLQENQTATNAKLDQLLKIISSQGSIVVSSTLQLPGNQLSEQDAQSIREMAFELSRVDVRLAGIADAIKRIEQKIDAGLSNLNIKIDEILKRLNQSEAGKSEEHPSKFEPQYTPEEKLVIEEALASKNALTRAKAAILKGEFQLADQELQQTDSYLQKAFDVLITRGNRHYFANEFDEAVPFYESSHQLPIYKYDPTALFNLAKALQRCHRGNTGELIDRAITLYEGLLELQPRDHFPAEWSITQMNLGNAWSDKPTGNKGENIEKAIQAYVAALEIRTRDRFPAEWARTQMNLGIAWAEKPTGDKGENIEKAIQAYVAALEIRTRDRFPIEWAITQMNLGIAWAEKPTGKKDENIDKAIQAFEASLEIRTRDRFPAEWARTQVNLGTAWSDKPSGNKVENTEKAIQAFETALEIRTRDRFPTEWAITQMNLGIAWAEKSTGNKYENIEKAIRAFEAALEVWTPTAFPNYNKLARKNLETAKRQRAEFDEGQKK